MKSEYTGHNRHKSSSSIRTIPSAPESHRINRKSGSQAFTAGQELHPALKIGIL